MKKLTIILFLFISVLTSCDESEESKIVDIVSLESNVDALIQQYIDLDIFSGVVLVAEKGVPKYHKAFGMADRANKTPNTINSKFDIGSMTKSFTKLIILQLIEEGKLKVTDKLGQYIAGFPEVAATKITINDLLKHSSGYTTYWGRNFNDLPLDQKRLPALIERIKKLRLQFEPGTDVMYSNAGYVLLGGIIEKISGKTYLQNITERILKPLGMTETYVVDKSEVPDRAIGYYKDMKGKLFSNTGFIEVPNPDGGLQSTPGDIVKFYTEYFYGSKLLSKEMKMNDDFFGFINKNRSSGKAPLMAGGFPGANTAYYEILRDEISIVVFANMDEPVGEKLAAGVLALVRGEQPIKPSLPAAQNVYNHYMKHGFSYIEEHFFDLIVNFHSEDPKGIIMNDIGYYFLKEEKFEEAKKFFKFNLKLFPDDANLWDSMGELYFKMGNKAKSLAHYKKALEIDPYMESAKEMIKKLE